MAYFIRSQLDASSFDYHDFQTIFLALRDRYTVFAHIYYNLPSYLFPAYMGVLDDINVSKGLVSLTNYSKLLSLNLFEVIYF